MKQLFTIILSALTYSMIAQTPLKIVQPTDLATDVNNTTITINGLASDPEFVASLWVINNGAASITLKCKKTEVDVLANTSNTTCWNLCPPTYDVAGTRTVVIVNINGTEMTETAAAGDTIKSFAGHYKPNNLDGCSLFKYEWFDQNDMNTALATVYIRYVHTTGACTASINEASKLEVNMYPVPANEELSISLAELPAASVNVEFLDVLGKVVVKQRISSAFSSVDVSELPEGVYFTRFIVNGDVASTKKIIIKR